MQLAGWIGIGAGALGLVAGAALAATTRRGHARRTAALEARLAALTSDLAAARAALGERDELVARAAELDRRAAALDTRKREVERAIDGVSHAQRQVVQSEKLASLGRMAAGVAHEFNNPAQHLIINLPFLRRAIDRLRRVLTVTLAHPPADPAAARELQKAVDEAKLARTNADLDEILEGLEEGATRIGELVRDLTTFSRMDAGELKDVDLHEGLDATIRLLGYRFKDRVEVERDYAALPAVRCHAAQINHVFMNVLSNAADAIPGRGHVWVKTERVGAERVRVRVTDDGGGMDAATLARIFDPFFTTKEPGQGTGLGLATSYDIVNRHGGTITAQSDPGIGTVFIVELPVVPTFAENLGHTGRSGE
ncbi:MAG: hypothetical protein IPK07_07345 [Deltaproteobacteria bacterium]|nr:hypothetical protein [Deltaproteobacteria bacterium]